MKKIVYPAVFEFDKQENTYIFNFEDINVISLGLSPEEAYLRACEDFQSYISFTEKFEFSLMEPTPFEEFEKLNPKKRIMLFSADVVGQNISLNSSEAAYKRLIQSMIE